MRVQLAEGWHIRPTQDGIELMAPERNLALELSDLAFRNECVAILEGEKEVPSNNKTLETALRHLERAGAILLQGATPYPKSLSVNKNSEAWDIRRNLVGTRGPVTAVYWLDPKQSRLSLSQTHLFTAKYREKTEAGQNTQEAWAAGSDPNWEQAEFKAIMEAIERHASGVVPEEQLIRTSSHELGKQALDPRSVIAYSRAQYRNGLPFVPFSRNREYYWKSVLSLPDNEEKYLPVECLYYPLEPRFVPNRYTAASSSGVAAGLSFEDALARGLYESIERDAFMAVWMNRMRMPRIDQNSIPEEYRERIHSLEALGCHVHFVDISLEIAPVILAVGVSENCRPSLALGAASGPHLKLAIGKALSEVEHLLYWEWRDQRSIRDISDPREVYGVLDHMALYASPQHLAKATFLWEGEILRIREHAAENTDFWSVIQKLEQHGVETMALDLTPEHMKSAGTWVVRALPLGLIPITFGYGNEPLGMTRHKEMADRGTPWPGQIPFTHPFA